MRKILPLFLILIASACSKEVNFFPENFFDLKLTEKISGEKAEEVVNRLHFDPVTSEKNEIAFYRGVKGNAIIYATYYSDSDAAIENYNKMTQKISPENSVFIQSSFIEMNDKTIFRTFGLGQTHYVFTNENKLFWLSVETIWAEKFLIEYLKLIE